MQNNLDAETAKPMVTVPRHLKILELLEERGYLSNAELSAQLGVSEQTIRRDIRQLQELNLLSRYHGGANRVVRTTMVNREFSERETTMVEEKKLIAQAVVDLITDGSTVFITIGTTVEQVAQVLLHKKNIRVITDSLRVAAILYANPDIEVIIPSGTLRCSNGGIEGTKTITDLASFRADFVVTSVGAIEEDGTLLDFNLTEIAAAQTMMEHGRKLIIAADHTKFDSVASATLGHLKDADFLVTDQDPPSSIQQVIADHGVRLIVAGPGNQPV